MAFWNDPETFRPERWLDGRDDTESGVETELTDAGRPTVAYAPYGAGPRNRLGRRMADRVLRTAVASICSRYRLTPGDDLVVSGGPTLTLDGGLSIGVHDTPVFTG
ncbi:cytochrome P450 [Halobaculum sp. MBLA0147]|uniref:cytochrome P450 n=1 Tax=Halobaculum sp. MBLA0147 TaxID=3079934 RepID=UPI0035262D6E